MKRSVVISHEFVKTIPDELEELTFYVSMDYATVVHMCCCGCGREVVTPLSPTDWTLIFDGVSISLSPSIGNWSFECRSHYWISKSKVRWEKRWSRNRIDAGRGHDRRLKAAYYGESETDLRQTGNPVRRGAIRGIWKWIWDSWRP